MWRGGAFAVAAAMVVAACDTTEPVFETEATLVPLGRVCTSTSPAIELASAARDSLPEFGHDQDYRWAEIATRVPGGWGGSFQVDGRRTMYLLEPDLRDEANEALMTEGIAPASEVLKGRWDFAQLYDWYRYLAVRIASEMPGVLAADIDEAQNWIRYGVRDQSVLDDLAVAAADLGIPCNLLAAKIVEAVDIVSTVPSGAAVLGPDSVLSFDWPVRAAAR